MTYKKTLRRNLQYRFEEPNAMTKTFLSWELHPKCQGRLYAIAAVCLLSLQVDTLFAASRRGDVQVVGRQELLDTMRRHGDYDPTATTNGARFQAEVLLQLARKANDREPGGSPLFVGHEDWFQAFLEVTGCTAETAPLYVLLAYRHGQDIEIDYRSDRIIQSVKNRDRHGKRQYDRSGGRFHLLVPGKKKTLANRRIQKGPLKAVRGEGVLIDADRPSLVLVFPISKSVGV